VLSKNQIWIGTNQGICNLNLNSERITNSKIINQIIGNASVSRIYEDKSGIIWIGTEKSGLYKFSSLDNVDHYTYDATISTSLSSNKVNTIYEDNSGIIWIGTQSGVDKFDKQKQFFKHYNFYPTTKIPLVATWCGVFSKDNSSSPTLFIEQIKDLIFFNKESGTSFFIQPKFKNLNEQKNESVYSILKTTITLFM
jgi:hypothetical protein